MSPGTLDPTALQAMAEGHRRRIARQARQASERAVLARREVERLADVFRSVAPDLEKMVLFGSLAHGRGFSSRSDIDLAVRCGRSSFLALVAEALRSPFRVDVVDLSDADERIQGAVEREGEVLYEK